MNFISTFDELSKLYEEDLQQTESNVSLEDDTLTETQEREFTIFVNNEVYCDDDGNPYYFDSSAHAEEFIAENKLEGAEVVRQAGKAKYEEACVKEELTEAAEEDEIEIVDDEIVDEAPVEEVPVEEPAEDEPKQLILECGNCGALILKDEDDIVTDEESDLVNVEDECEYCEETKGYKIIGVVAPYEDVETEEPVEDIPEDDFVEESVEAEKVDGE